MAFSANTQSCRIFFEKNFQNTFKNTFENSTLLYSTLLYSTLLYSTQEKNTFESTLTWKTLSVKLHRKLMNFPYQILEFELESLFHKRWDEKPRRAVLASVLD